MKKISLLLMIMVLALSSSAAPIDGIVVNHKDKAMKNIKIYSMRTKESVNTDPDGKFHFSDIAEDDTLAVCANKGKEARFAVAGLSDVKIKIDKKCFYVSDGDNESKHSYHMIRNTRRPLNIITRSQVEESNAESIYDLIRGRLAGVQIIYGDNGPKIVIRGASSLNANIEPVFVVDGMVYGSSTDVDNGLNVREIETVEVSKEGLDYGSKGVNGAIIITTVKKARSKN